ncbi:MAG: T9SS type A sorting domain-containing protein [Tenuifilaceae bacterium]|nr:T9SS type A sorting domain-containing protein [Tenuifilaceae bacterium]
MKRIIITFLLAVSCIFLFSQNYMINWQACYGGSKDDHAIDMVEFNNLFYILGYTFSDDGDISLLHGENDFWLVCTDSQGNMLWEKTYGGSEAESGHRILSTGKGYFYLLGTAFSSDGDITNDPYKDSPDYWIVKIDSLGNIIWDKIVGGSRGERIWTGALTSDGGLVAIGETSSNDGDISVFYGGNDSWLVKISNDGKLEWDFTLGTDFADISQAIIQTSDGGYLVGGSSMLGEGGNITCEPHSSMADAILTKLDADRNIEWQRCYGGSEHDGIVALIEIEDGYVFGAYTSSNDGDVFGWHSGYNHLGNPTSDMWIVKTDFDGNIIWQNALGGSDSESPYRIFEDSFYNIFIFGRTYSNDGDVSGNHSISEYYPDIWVVELDSDGMLTNQQCFGGEGRDHIENGIVFIDRNHFVIAGQTYYGPSFDVGCTPHGGNGGDSDIWVFEVKDTTVSVPEQPPATTGITAYPNPAKDYVCFERKGKASSGHLEISIFSASGIPVKELTLYPGETIKVWDTRTIRAGVYFYRSLRKDGTAEYGKIVLE